VSDMLAVFRDELRRIFALRPAFAIFVLGSVVYAVFYPQPYLNEALRNVPMALVDQDGTTSSRELARRIDATSDVAIAMVLADVPTAQRAVYERAVFGILVIPQYF
jgi:ABC-2 type transport system permease protein